MDSFDKHILQLLQQNNRLTTEKIGELVGLSATACQRRIKKLRDSGIIHKEVAVLDSVQLGNYVTVIVEVTMKQGGSKVMDQFRQQMQNHSNVQQCYYVTGEHDFVLIITCASMLEYDQLTRQLFLDNTNIHKFRTTVAMENVKLGLEVPIKEVLKDIH